jgi:hypothetical protein
MVEEPTFVALLDAEAETEDGVANLDVFVDPPDVPLVAADLGRCRSVSPSRHGVDPDTARRLTQVHLRDPKRFGRRCREPVAGSVPAVNATTMGRTSTEEKHDG